MGAKRLLESQLFSQCSEEGWLNPCFRQASDHLSPNAPFTYTIILECSWNSRSDQYWCLNRIMKSAFNMLWCPSRSRRACFHLVSSHSLNSSMSTFSLHFQEVWARSPASQDKQNSMEVKTTSSTRILYSSCQNIGIQQRGSTTPHEII